MNSASQSLDQLSSDLRAEDLITMDDLPVSRAEIELSAPPSTLKPVSPEEQTSKIITLVRLYTQPLGVVVLDGTKGLAWQTHSSVVWAAMRQRINSHLEANGLQPVDDIDAINGSPHVPPKCMQRRAVVLADPPRITVVIATRERCDNLRVCLEALRQVEYPHYEIVVVDNDPVTTDTETLVTNSFPEVRYVCEKRRGLSSAHNRGLVEVNTEIVAFVDDDCIVDRYWLTSIAEGFAAGPDVRCVTGLILTAELATPAQLLLQRHGSYDKGFELRLFDMGRNRPDDPLFPFTAGRLGSGANMAFDTNTLRGIGGFDPALGTGTVTRSGDDLLAFFRVVLKHQLAYQPAAIVWHRHHRDMAAVPNQAVSYGVGFGAFVASVVVHEPNVWLELLRRLPGGLKYGFSPTSARNRHRYDGIPKELARRENLGLLYGPVLYAKSRWKIRRGAMPR